MPETLLGDMWMAGRWAKTQNDNIFCFGPKYPNLFLKWKYSGLTTIVNNIVIWN